MINRDVLNAQRDLYVQGREKAIASISAFNGAIECLDNLLSLLDQADAAKQTEQAADAAKEQ